MERKRGTMLNQAAFVALSICFISSEAVLFAAEHSKTSTKSEKIFTDSEKPSFADTESAKTRYEKSDLVKNAEAPLSDSERQRLQKKIQKPEKKSAYFALCKLVKIHDTQSVDQIIEILERGEIRRARYYALALGYLGDDKAIPVLKKTIRETEHNYVRDDCRFALRLLDASTDESPPDPTEGTTVEMELSASKKQITAGESFVLKASIKNLGEQPVRISPEYDFFEDYLRVYAKGGQYVLRFREGHIKAGPPKFDDFPKIPVGKSMTVKQNCSVNVEKVFSDKWLHKGHKAFVFHPGDDPFHLFDVGMYKPGKKLSLQLVSVYEASHQATYEDFETETPLITGKIVTNTVTLDVKAPKE